MADIRHPDSDAQLVERTCRGDSAAFEALVRRHYRAAWSVAMSVLGNGMDAEDVCQNAFVRALERIDACEQPDRFAGWILQIVRNRARNFRDYRRVRMAEPLETAVVASTVSTADDVERGELRDLLEGALGALTPVQREVVLWHDFEGWKHREIGEALEISEGMSRQHLFAARRALRERLGSRVLKEYANE